MATLVQCQVYSRMIEEGWTAVPEPAGIAPEDVPIGGPVLMQRKGETKWLNPDGSVDHAVV